MAFSQFIFFLSDSEEHFGGEAEARWAQQYWGFKWLPQEVPAQQGPILAGVLPSFFFITLTNKFVQTTIFQTTQFWFTKDKNKNGSILANHENDVLAACFLWLRVLMFRPLVVIRSKNFQSGEKKTGLNFQLILS